MERVRSRSKVYRNMRTVYRCALCRGYRLRIKVYDGRGATSFKSLVLLGLLVLVAWTALFTLSQITMQGHNASGYYKPNPYKPDWDIRPGLIKALQKLFKVVKASQFKIEPLLDKNAPGVEENAAKQLHIRNSRRISSILLAESMRVFSINTEDGDNNNKNDSPSSVQRRVLDRRKILSSSSDTFDSNTSGYSIANEGGNESMDSDLMSSQGNYSTKEINLKELIDTFRDLVENSEDEPNSLSDPFTEFKMFGLNKRSGNRSGGLVDISQSVMRCFTKVHRLSDSSVDFLRCLDLKSDSFSSNKVPHGLTSVNWQNETRQVDNHALYRRYVNNEAKTRDTHRKLSLCPEVPPNLMGKLDEMNNQNYSRDLAWVRDGGSWSPVHDAKAPCLPRHKVGIIVPYRDRAEHLAKMLNWLHPLLRKQQLEYTIYVAEQVGNITFNKGAIMNAGFLEVFTKTDAQCFVFHDVDLLAEDDRNLYSCPASPRHLSVGVDTLNYKLPYYLLVGGVMAIKGHQFLRLNGYSNMYWGWGGEDDDMGYRMVQSGLGIIRPPFNLARFTMIKHIKRKPLIWKVRGNLVRTSSKRYRMDGLNTLKYELVRRSQFSLYTHLLLYVGRPPNVLVNFTP